MSGIGTSVLTERVNLFNELVGEVRKRHLNPEDKYEVAAIIESLGWNDNMAADVFGADDVFALAADVWEALQTRPLLVPAVHVKKMNFFKYLGIIISSFLRGTIFAFPMAVSVFFMLTLRFSLWSYLYLSLEYATSIALGTILSFMAVGGFTQAIARRGFLYIGQGHYYMARKVTFYFLKIGYPVCIIAAFAFLLFNAAFTVFPWRMALVAVLYFLFLCSIWLSVTIMYMLRKELVFTGLIIAGIMVVFVLFKLLGLNIILSQLIAMTLVSIAGIAVALYFFLREERRMEKGIKPLMPRFSIIFYTCIPYFIYGFLYFTFFFIDRLVAWSTNSLYMPYLIWFRGQYELGLDFSLIALILPIGLVEVFVSEIMTRLEIDQKIYKSTDAGHMGRAYVRSYVKRIFCLALFSLANAAALYLVMKRAGGSFSLGIFSNNTTHFVFIWSVISYAVVAVALMNTLLLFCLSQPGMACKSALYAIIVNMFLGFLLSRWVDYSWAVLGLFAGSLVFALFTARRVMQVLNDLDYYLYTAA
ncbi:MAG TPA: hypothetical protein PK728_03910 [Bacillota bacterium]|nr:hypothetical protein [Bacillota bacterium]